MTFEEFLLEQGLINKEKDPVYHGFVSNGSIENGNYLPLFSIDDRCSSFEVILLISIIHYLKRNAFTFVAKQFIFVDNKFYLNLNNDDYQNNKSQISKSINNLEQNLDLLIDNMAGSNRSYLAGNLLMDVM